MTAESDGTTTVHTQIKQPEGQKERWRERAGDHDATLSEFIRDMVESGMKPFVTEVERDESIEELREQRNDLRDELDHARRRIEDLEDQVYRSERAAIDEFISENPGVEFADVVQYTIDTAGERVGGHLDALAGDSIQYDPTGDRYYPLGEDS
jgi:ElaB/YqjD/DUF883 family membrane-anchored ribosome-binding protein